MVSDKLKAMLERSEDYAYLLADIDHREAMYIRDMERTNSATIFMMGDWYRERIELMRKLRPRVKRMYKGHLQRIIKTLDNEQ